MLYNLKKALVLAGFSRVILNLQSTVELYYP